MYLPIDTTELRMFEAIDGVATAGDILVRTGAMRPAELRAASSFFERLWWYDQIVFDRSQS